MSDFNERVGANLSRLRRFRGLSQSDLAERLTDAGLSFQQQTVLKIEKGSRPLRFEEAVQIAKSLGVETQALIETSSDDARSAELMLEGARLGRRINELAQEQRELETRRADLQDEYNQMQARRATEGDVDA